MNKAEFETYTTGTGQTINVHSYERCRGEHCAIHNPSETHMKGWKTHWRHDRNLMERVCEHGVGHPDPDHINHLPMGRRLIESGHGCDGCCAGPR